MNAYQKSNHVKLAEENDLKVILALQREAFYWRSDTQYIAFV